MNKGMLRMAQLLGIGFVLCALLFVQCAPEKAEEAGKVKASGATLWQELRKADYKNMWRMWPGTSAFYPGSQPHGVLLTTYVNDNALRAIEGKRGQMPDGAIVAKENYSGDKQLMALTVMYKIKGYNPEAGDWFWAKYRPDGNIEGEGKMQMCIGCHAVKADNDYLFTGALK